MRTVLRTVCLALALLVAVGGSAVAKQRRQVVLHLQWRVVATASLDVVATDRYVAFTGSPAHDATNQITLIDQQRRTRQTLTPPNCADPQPPMLGGGRLLIFCGPGPYDVYDIASGEWTSVNADCPANTSCIPAGIGQYWLKLASVTGPGGADCSEHCMTSYVLQNLATGAVVNDPATPGGRTYDDLDAPAGSRPLCSPVRYPTNFDNGGHLGLGQLTFGGSFVVTAGNENTARLGLIFVDRLRRCGSSLNLPLPAGDSPGPLISPRAVAWQQDVTTGPIRRRARLAGRFLPSLESFTAVEAPLPPGSSQPTESLVALTTRTVYVQGEGGRLWAASLPTH
jgi:hypothetical protein